MTAPRARVLQLVAAARRLADPRAPLGVEARAVLPGVTGLSPEGVELALTRCLETRPTDAELDALLASVAPAPRAHVLLSANVFVAAHRAVALALAASSRVSVRPSRREPHTAALLARGAPGLFDVVDELAPSAGDHVFAYGTDETLAALAARLPAGVVLHGHGSGVGVAVIDARHGDDSRLAEVAGRLADDVVPFDQRGCLSPRLALVLGDARAGRAFAASLAASLATWEERVPLGRLAPDEVAQVTRYRDAARYAAELLPAGRGWVGLDVTGGPLVVPPTGRNVQVTVSDDVAALAPLRGKVACFAPEGAADLTGALTDLFPGARRSRIGDMQRPPFDGPVEVRSPR